MDHADASDAGDQDVGGHQASQGHPSASYTSAQSTLGFKSIHDKVGHQLQHLPNADLIRIYGVVGHYIKRSGDHDLKHLNDSHLRDLHHELSTLAEEGHISHSAVTHGYHALLGLAKHD